MQLWKGFGPIVATGYLTLNWILWIGYDRLKYVSKILFESSFGILRYTFLVFKKVISTGLNSLRQKGYRISVKIWIFDKFIQQKGNRISHFGTRDNPTIRTMKFFNETRLLRLLRPLRLQRPMRSTKLQRF